MIMVGDHDSNDHDNGRLPGKLKSGCSNEQTLSSNDSVKFCDSKFDKGTFLLNRYPVQ